ncbi:universal stress protein [Algoriphagus sp. CAU 1675]|uniref:universal stress protein n=1 Tax=Algoriphagus sp. CAU 1675 TaxID=3032597 RepID=UPI0023DCAA71|nr:universal stress protein [Algoriphagus sp. CAU 1675]MDF2158219.1 universal stress protein [Algoriphagus sp. CAU 1675]
MKIVVPVDFSENSIKALEFAIALADKKHGSITLVHVIDLVYDFASQAAIALESMHKDAEAMMNKLIQTYSATEIKMDYLIKEGTTSVTVVKIADEQQASLIVMGTQGASGLKKALIGSTTVNLIKEANIPVLVVPASAIVSQIQKVTLALEFANHEEKFIDWVVNMSGKWGLGLEFLHVQTDTDFKNSLSSMGLEKYLEIKYPELNTRIHTFYAESASAGLEQYLDEHENLILVMCHEHRNLWNQILTKSQSVEMAYHTHVPLLVMS